MAVLPSGYTYLQTLEDGVLRKLYTAARHDGVPCLCEEVFVGPPPAPSASSLRACSASIARLDSPFLGKYILVQPDNQRRSVFLLSQHVQDFSLFTLFTAHTGSRPYTPEDDIWQILYGALQGLAYLHSPLAKPVLVHGAISPTSVYVSRDGAGLLRSLWSVRESGSPFTGDAYSPLTPYVAPEVLKSQAITTKADVWALGCVIYELCAQKQLFAAASEEEMVARILTPVSVTLPPQYSRDLVTVLRAMLEQDPFQRPGAVVLLGHPRFEHFDNSLPEDHEATADCKDPTLSRVSTVLADSTMSFSSVGSSVAPLLPESNSPLSQAIAAGNKTAFTKALGAWKGKPDSNGYSSLMYAIVYQNTPMAKLLLKSDAGLQDRTGRSALMYASSYDKLELVQELIRREGRLRDRAGRTALMHAAASDSLLSIRALIPLEAGLADNEGSTALMIAIKSGAYRAVSMLYIQEARYQSMLGKTALMLAAQLDCGVAINLLAEEETYLEDSYGMTASQYAELAGNQVGELALREHDQTIVTGKTVAGRLSPLPKLGIKGGALTLEERERVNMLSGSLPRDEQGNTSLMLAILAGDRISAESYLPSQMGFRNADSETALMLCAKKNLSGIAALLLAAESGLRVGLSSSVPKERVGMTALMHAAEANAVEVCKVLLTAEAGSVRKDGKTALILAAMADAKDAALVLGACDKEAGQHDTNGFTALMGAVQHRNVDLAKLLLKKEAGFQKNDGTAAIHIAVFLEDVALVKLLFPYEKDLQLADGRTAQTIAIALNNPALQAVFDEPTKKRSKSRAQGSAKR